MNWRKWIASCMLCAVLGMPAATVRADEDEVKHDARTEGYEPKGQSASTGTALTWIAFIFLSAISMAVMFKDSKRSHLD